MDNKILKSKFLAAMLGSALGDAIGELAFKFRERGDLLKIIDEIDQLKYTDDTAMAIGIAESICENNKIDTEKLGDTFRKNYEQEPWRGYGSGPPYVFSLVRKGYSYTQAAKLLFNGEGSFGNGAAMRITPVGLFFFDSQNLYREVYKSAQPTHANPLGKDGAAVLAEAIAQVVKFEPGEDFSIKNFCKNLRSFARTDKMKRKIDDMEEFILNNISKQEVIDKLGTDVTASDSVPFAIYSFLKNRTSFVNCLLETVLAGGDRDTIGCMSCAISGAYLGIESIPSRWIEKLENRGYIEELSLKLLSLKMNCLINKEKNLE